MADRSEITELLFKWFTRKLKPVERKRLDEWLQEKNEHRILLDQFNDIQWFAQEWKKYKAFDKEAHWNKILASSPTLQTRFDHSFYPRTRAAKKTPIHHLTRRRGFFVPKAAVFILLTASLAVAAVYTFWPPSQPQKVVVVDQHRPAPATNVATLQLASGAVLDMATLADGKIAQEGCMDIYKDGPDKVIFSNCSPVKTENDRLFNVLSTPRAGLYKLVLPDGSTVELNAETSLSFNTSFNSTQRDVFLEGEAFFNVVSHVGGKQSAKPFVVHVRLPSSLRRTSRDNSMMTVISTGTQFDIKAYPSDPVIHTTLIEGSVTLKKDSLQQILNRGQTVTLGNHRGFILEKVPAVTVIPWKEGEFSLIEQPVDEILQELSRWYDVIICYKEEKLVNTCTLKGLRSQSLDELLKELGKMGCFHYTISKDTVFVSH
jgi:transmembrane sensor